MYNKNGGEIMEEKAKIKSLGKAMDVLGIMAESQIPLSLTEISKLSGYPVTTVYGILVTLRDYDIVEQKLNDGKYILGKRLFEWGMSVSSVWDVSSVAHPVMEDISKKIGESVLLSMLDGESAMVIDHVEAYGGLRVAARPGSCLPLNATSQGKVLLSNLSISEIKRIMKKAGYVEYTPHTIVTEEKLFNELSLTARRGYGIEDGEFRVGLRSVSAPVYGRSGKVEYALTMTGMFRRITSKEFEDAIAIVTKAAEKISYLLGYRTDRK